MRTLTLLRLAATGAALSTIAACAGQSSGAGEAAAAGQPSRRTAVSPTELVIPPAGLPGPGLCQIYDLQNIQTTPSQSCNGIENLVRPGGAILYRPKDGSRNVVVCYVSPAERGLIYGADLFDIDTRQNIAVLIPRGGPPPKGGCPGALANYKP
jgi:hypothetical protein